MPLIFLFHGEIINDLEFLRSVGTHFDFWLAKAPFPVLYSVAVAIIEEKLLPTIVKLFLSFELSNSFMLSSSLPG